MTRTDPATREAPWRRRFRAARMSLPSWARDDPERLVYVSNATGRWEVYAWDRGSDTHRQVTDRPEGTFDAALDPSGSWIWWFDDRSGDEFGVWRVEPFAGGVAPSAPGNLQPAYQAGLAVGAAFALVGRSTEGGTSVERVAPGDAPSVVYRHREDASVAGLARDEDLWCLSHSEHGDSRHPDVRVLDPDGEAVAELSDGPGRGLWPAGWSPVPGDRRLLIMHERPGLLRPLLWSPLAGEERELPVELPGEIEASWYPDGRSLLLAHDHRGRVELYRLDLRTGALEALPVETGTVADARVRPDGEVWYAWSRSSSPPVIRTLGGAQPVRPPGEPAPPGAAYQPIDAGKVPAFLAEPPGPRPHPTIFVIHGGPEWHDRDAFSPMVQAFVDHGMAVALVNYRGSTGYGRDWRDAITANPGLTELEDIATVHDRVVAAGIADPARTILSGASWGGYLTLLGLGTQPERWAAAIAAVPVADYIAAYEDEMEPLKAFDRALFGGSPEEVPEVYRQRSPITFVEAVRAPVMILLGENDPRCPVRQVDNYLERLRALGREHEVYRYDAGHGSLVVEETLRQVQRQLEFLARHVGTPRPA